MSSSQEKHLPATARRLDRARVQGQVGRSRDLGHFLVLALGAASLWLLLPFLLEWLARGLRQALVFDAAVLHAPQVMLEQLRVLVLPGILACAVFATVTAVGVLSGALGAGGWIFSVTPLTPQWTRLNPLRGLANLFSRQQLANVSKMLLLVLAIVWVAYHSFRGGLQQLPLLAWQPESLSLRHAGGWVTSGLGLLLLVLLFFALVDVPLQGWLFRSRLKMSHEEVKREHKDSDGDPRIKSKMRHKQREMLERMSVSAVPRADFVVMNPSHYAVALRYDESCMRAPQVVSKGVDVLALRIRELARQHSVPVLHAPALARALYAHADVEQPVPPQLYAAVAQVLAYVWRLKAASPGGGLPFEAPPEPQVPPELDPHSEVYRPRNRYTASNNQS